MIKYALAYAKRGFPVVRLHTLTHNGQCTCGANPCKPAGKHPVGSPHPTTSADAIKAWPNVPMNVGIYPDQSFFVLDVDSGSGGLTTLAQWEVQHGRLPATPTVRTGSGGFHFYFARPAGLHVKNWVKFAPGCDVRADGGMVVAPPSMHKSGTPYAWDMERGGPSLPFAQPPAWLLALFPVKKPTIFDGDSPLADVDLDTSAAAAAKRLRSAIKALAEHPDAIEGEGGDLTTLKAASIGYDFGVSEALWAVELAKYNAQRCDPPWAPDALAEKLRSAYTNNSAEHPFGWKLRPLRRDPKARPALTATTDRALADSWLKEQGHVRIVSGYTYVYADSLGIWERWDEPRLKAALYDLHGRDVLTEDGKTNVVNMTSARVKAVADAVRHTTALMDDDFFAVRRIGVMTKSGFLAVNVLGQVVSTEKSPDHRIRNAVPVEYDPEADYTLLTDLLRHTFEGDADANDKIAALQEFYGAALMGMATDYAKALMMVGNGANGKSTIMELFEDHLFVPSLTASTPPQKWTKHEYVFQLADKLLNSVSEVPDQRILASDTLKQVISGEALSARPIFGQLMRFKPYAAHVFSANELPAVSDHSQGFWRRFLVITFNRNFLTDPERKTKDQIKAQFEDHGPALLRWALEGAARLALNRAYTEPESHLSTLVEWKRDTNDVAVVAAKCFVATPDKETASKELYATYREVCDAEGLRPVSHTLFGRKMAALFGRSRKSNGKVLYSCVIRHESEWDVATVQDGGFKERRTYSAEELITPQN